MAVLASDLLSQFRLYLCNNWKEFNKPWQKARSQRSLPHLVLCDRSEKQDGHPGTRLAESFLILSLQLLNEILRSLTWSNISNVLYQVFLFLVPIGKPRWLPWHLIGLDNFNFISATVERNSTKLDISQIQSFSTKFLFLEPIGKPRWPSWHLIDWDIVDFFSATAERNSIQLDRKKYLNVFFQVYVYGPIEKKNHEDHYSPDCRIHFRHLFNGWKGFNETWQEARSQCPLSHLVLWGRSEKKNKMTTLATDRLAESFLIFSLQPLNEIQRSFTWSKISNILYQVCVFGAVRKPRWLPWHLIGLDNFNCICATVERNSTKLDMKLDPMLLYQVFVFGADWETRMAALASDRLRHFRLLLCNRWTEFNETWKEARSQRLVQSLCFGPIRKPRWHPWSLIGWEIFDFYSYTAEMNSTKLDRKQDLNVLYQICFSGLSENQEGRPRPLICWDIFDL